MALAYRSLLGMYPKADERPKSIRIPISPFDTGVASELARQDHLEDLTFVVPSGKRDCHSSPVGLGYLSIAQLLGQCYRLRNLKTATIRAKNVGMGLVKWPKHAPPQIVMALCERELDELAFERTELPVEAPYPAKLFGETKSKKLVFYETHMWLTEKLFGDMVGVELSAQVESLEFLDVKDDYFVSWVLGLVPQGKFVMVKYRNLRKEKFTPETWRFLKPHLGCINSLCIESGGFFHTDCDFPIWREDLCDSPVRDLHLEQPIFGRESFRYFLTYIEIGPLESLRISGNVTISGDTKNERLNATRDLLNSISKSNIKWLSFPWTDCGVGACIAEAIPSLKVEVLDIGLFPPQRYENNPGTTMLEKLRQNTTIGAIADPVRKRVADELGIVGLQLRSILHEGKNMSNEERNWSPLTYAEVDLVNEVCRRNLYECYHEISRED